MEILVGKSEEIRTFADVIRHDVFIKEQGVPLDEIFDEKMSLAVHIVVMEDGLAVATSRIVKEDAWRIGLVAVEKNRRGLGYGKIVIEEAIQYIKNIGGNEIVLSAQDTAKGFYEKLGFAQYDEEICYESGFVIVPMKLYLN